ncbi:hypothetical protein WA1_22740 [Scytonema hofmannii PCC 7110]|jgi:hypothetical protein|uniref:Uncharacterized protein n=1 Tax=Scytonema hofmannii PCC 7110 TaxID=128403 RepID=A0A139X8S2_9CYAN|nr:hypothetical protein [Scytonema hofmannii]KYC41111.1 hypothetical protein WA1_22740 [Scytonema hofmannii PCC 7110]
MINTQVVLRNEVQHLAEEAFHHKLISGYGDGPNNNEYQIVFQGKPRHFSLEEARSFLCELLFDSQEVLNS